VVIIRNPAALAGFIGSAALTVCAAIVSAQEGFPLDGTWRGEWGDPAAPNPVVIVMKWNGEAVTGRINPGPRSMMFDTGRLDPSDWSVTISATDSAGASITINGTLTDIGSYNRRIEGTWTLDGVEHPFAIARE